MKRERDMPIKIRRISIRNYKGIDELDMEFPLPRLPDDPDIFVMGSSNGLGKTSIIECCALLLGLMLREDLFRLEGRYSIVDVPDLLIRAGARSAEIRGEIVSGDKVVSVEMRMDRQGRVKLSSEESIKNMLENRRIDPESNPHALLGAICGFTPNPVIENTFLLFHSYRKVQEGNPEMGMMLRGENPRRPPGMRGRYEFPMSAFKLQILRSLMGQANLFEFDEKEGSGETIEALNELVETYAGGTISKLRPSPDNTIDFRVDPVGGAESFTFDGLSSGQKEIISTLFLIWYHTRNRPSVVFIDEPELHLNPQWHRRFVKNLNGLAPWNQYIIATHSEDVMASVSEDRRVLLSSDQGAGE